MKRTSASAPSAAESDDCIADAYHFSADQILGALRRVGGSPSILLDRPVTPRFRILVIRTGAR